MRVLTVCAESERVSGEFGGGYWYPHELARALARIVDVEVLELDDPTSAWRQHRRFRDADIVHVHQPALRVAASAVHVARAVRTPVVATDLGLGVGPRRTLTPLLTNHFLCISQYAARTISAPAERKTVIYGGADPEQFRPEPKVVRRGVVYVGRLVPHKGIEVAIGALPAGESLTVVGPTDRSPKYVNYLRECAIGKDVTFTGRVERDALTRALRTALVAVVPSLRVDYQGRQYERPELLGLVALEAMASGTPVIASDLGGLDEIVEPGVNGYLIEPGDEGQLSEHLTSLVRNPERAAAMGAAGRDRVLTEFTWDACAARCVAAYGELVPARNVP